MKTKLILTGLLILIFLLLTGILSFSYYLYSSFTIGTKDEVINRRNTGLVLEDDRGIPFFTFYKARTEKFVPLAYIPQNVQNALIVTEDKDFYRNPGFSIRGIIRSLWVNFSSGMIKQGGSTISQELVKNIYLSPDKSLIRKYQEVIYAYALNKKFSKQEILEMYLNSVYFGEGAFGIGNAAETYFGKEAKDLDLAQAALLVALLPAPSSLSPLSNDPKIIKNNQVQVIHLMAQSRTIGQNEAQKAAAEELNYTTKSDNLNMLAPHFALYVRDLLIKKYGEETVAGSGFTVKTTLNREWQEKAQKTLTQGVLNLAGNRATNGAAVVLDPKNGEIKAMVGSVDWNNQKFGKVNMAVTPRSPGSSFKPVIYADALEKRIITTATLLRDLPTTYPGDYKPRDYDGAYRGYVTTRKALANSLNIPAVEVMNKLGVAEGLEIAQKMGIKSLGRDDSKYGLSLVLGGGEISLLELTGAYGVFANKGLLNTPQAISEIRDKYDKVLENNYEEPKQAVTSETAYLISSILADNFARAEVFGNSLTINRTAAVKTGTAEDYRNALTLGYTPSLAVGVWVGNNDNTPMDKVAGALGAAPIWRSLMEEFLKGKPDEKFEKPSGIRDIRICVLRGLDNKFATSSGSFKEYFLAGTENENSCENNPLPTNIPNNPPLSVPTVQAFPTLNLQPIFPLFKNRGKGRNK